MTAAASGSPVSINGDFHASYSPIKHGTVMVNYFRARSSFEDVNFFSGPTYVQSAKGYLVEAAAGGSPVSMVGDWALALG